MMNYAKYTRSPDQRRAGAVTAWKKKSFMEEIWPPLILDGLDWTGTG